VTECACEEILSLPIGPYLDTASQLHVLEILREALDEYRVTV